ncbi:hypothetical protein ACJJTC_008593 [Scirpophaga incertulas]
MSVTNAMFLFEVVVEHVKSLVETRWLVIRSEFADIFSLELKDPKQMHIVIPEPPPLPPEPVGKKGKKKKPPKPKKGKKGKVEAPPPEPVIQSGQSVLFTSSPEFLLQTMKKFPLEISLWNKEDNLSYIGSNSIPWDPIFTEYLQRLSNCVSPLPITLNEEYNIFEEGTAKLMAKIGIQVKLTYLTDKISTAFRTLSEDPAVKKVLYTGINSKTTSYICTLKTTDKIIEQNSNKIETTYIKDKPKTNKIVYADYKNAPGANFTLFKDGNYCCMGNTDKPPETRYKAPETCPDIDSIIDYISKIILSCNDNMRMLTPRPTISPRIKATDIDRSCFCKETGWPAGELAKRFKKEAESEPCPICVNAENKPEGLGKSVFDIANIRGPCGKHDCRIARDLRAYLENLIEEDNVEFNINDIIGPCGSKSCDLAEKIQQFLRHENVFSQGSTIEGLSTQCACLKTMQDSLLKKQSSVSFGIEECEDCNNASTSEEKGGYTADSKVYNVYYFTIAHDFDKSPKPVSLVSSESSSFKYCSTDCPSHKTSEKTMCTKSNCSSQLTDKTKGTMSGHSKSMTLDKVSQTDILLSPADSEVILNLEDIYNPCCVENCDVAERVKSFIAENSKNRRNEENNEDPCYCDCDCTFKFSRKTTYCAVCGGYECLGDDMKDEPEYVKPHPCPVYHKLYDKKYIKTPNPWPEENESKQHDNVSPKSIRSMGSKQGSTINRLASAKTIKTASSEKKVMNDVKVAPQIKEKKKVGKFTANTIVEPPLLSQPVEKKLDKKYPYPAVPKHMGWNWNAEDIPGMKPRPKWRPGAANKILVRRYRALREGVDILARKKRALMQRKKKIEMKPTLVVKKQGGEYTVQMEVFKKYSKERLLFQYPYDEKPPLIYTIGKSAEEKQKRQKRKERKERRETRRKCRLLQSTFRDKCQEICLKAYNQAIGLAPLPNPNDPECPCFTENTQAITPTIDSCSCSEEGTLSSSDTDDDEWVIEFTPPVAKWNAKAKHPVTQANNETQYTYLDYKVKVLDKSGNPVPRYFKGPDGKQECSDLGGFWGPGHHWLEINKDGYIGPDNRWVPMNFTGPDGMFYSAEDGFFVDATGQELKIGIDGYIDKDEKWTYYSKKKGIKSVKSTLSSSPKPTVHSLNKNSPDLKTKGREISFKGKQTNNNMQQNLVKKSLPNAHTNRPNRSTVMSATVNCTKNLLIPTSRNVETSNLIKDTNLIAKYNDIMKDLQFYDDICEIRPPPKTNRASNTPCNNPRFICNGFKNKIQ